jgi:hypothetical protein
MFVTGHMDEKKFGTVVQSLCYEKGYTYLGAQLKYEWAGRFSFDFGFNNHGQITLLEFDGSSHYAEASSIERDRRKWKLVQLQGIKMISVPYYLQLFDPNIFKWLFGTFFEIKQDFPNGFISKKCVVPGEFCYAGMKRFIDELEQIRNKVGLYVISAIYGSLLWQQVHRKWDSDLIFGDSLSYFDAIDYSDLLDDQQPLSVALQLDNVGFGNFVI